MNEHGDGSAVGTRLRGVGRARLRNSEDQPKKQAGSNPARRLPICAGPGRFLCFVGYGHLCVEVSG